ncbi:flagellar basal body rod protein FlgB [Halalkalibacter akibai]|uniref:Flagellar basal body rod protein FlgB n=1 Tax=Halalkalibacter akibai (strain ATCC 43226 / DSM 21942 / CIP 109018 / JCM 9157 / 1139) TaxID=1236973 RepID=W4QV52_HALA3|nr:flagellar basal body rod protein FlgB [Halalkalibacter akibai]GAE36020.1 flagellar basal-body rod protein FlgB [Halalkalibacter akibai JCM 9157]
MDLFGSSSFKAIERGLEGAQLRQKAISQNIANVDTPNYKAKQVSFKHTFQNEMNNQTIRAHKTSDGHIDFGTRKSSPSIEINRSTMYNHNNNNVDIDLEMAELAKNQIYYNALIDRLNGRFTSLQTVIKGGR